MISGAGYEFNMLAEAAWLHGRTIHYRDNIDTHDFAILDRSRALFPPVRSFLMNKEILSAHRSHWIEEPQPVLCDLQGLNTDERQLFDDLKTISSLAKHGSSRKNQVSPY